MPRNGLIQRARETWTDFLYYFLYPIESNLLFRYELVFFQSYIHHYQLFVTFSNRIFLLTMGQLLSTQLIYDDSMIWYTFSPDRYTFYFNSFSYQSFSTLYQYNPRKI